MPDLIDHPIDTDDPAFLYLNLHPDEEIQLIVRHHWAGFLGTLLLVFGMMVVPLFLLFAVSLVAGNIIGPYRPLLILFVSGFFLFLLTFLFGSWINFYYDIIFVTNQRILNVNQEGLLSRQTAELDIREIQNVSARTDGLVNHPTAPG